MATGVGKVQILHMYKSLLRESQKFANYNFKNYAFRKVKDSFKANKTLTDTAQITQAFAFAQENLVMMKRQASIGDMYRTEKLVIENKR